MLPIGLRAATRCFISSVLTALGLSLIAPARAQVSVENAFPNLTFPYIVDAKGAGDGTNRMFVASQSGQIWVFPNTPNAARKTLFLTLSNRIQFDDEEGLLGLAFHPNFAENRYFYVSYTADNPRRTVVSRFQALRRLPNRANPLSEQVILEVEQPFSNHNTHRLEFGPDGYLYIAAGDGGGTGDPEENGQDRTTLQGSILRIDVDNPAGGRAYSIPPDNPFVGNTQGYREEIYAYGLRNPWRFSFDQDGRLWAADVGQDRWEEIDWVESGGNYGWNVAEGNHCYSPAVNCGLDQFEAPVWEYPHNPVTGGFSITGGYVYTGRTCPPLQGNYVYADFISQNIWGLSFDQTGVTDNQLLLKALGVFTAAFGVDDQGELYGAHYAENGYLYNLVCGSATNDDIRTKPGNVIPEGW